MAYQQPERVALVTGGAAGIGRAIARRSAADGIAVAIAYHANPADAVVDEIVADGGTAIAIALDVTDRAMVDAVVDAVVERLGRLDILVNNAGGLLARVSIETMPDEHWQRVMDLNLASAFFATRAAARHLGRDGRIVNVIGDSPFHATFSSAEAQALMVAQTAVGRPGRPDDIAALVSYLVGPQGGFITGAVIDVNGGSSFS